MKINTPKATNFKLTPALTEYLEKKLKTLERFFDPSDETAAADVEIGRTTHHHKHGEIFRAEVNLTVAGKRLRAEAESSDLYAAIDEVKDELHRLLTSDKSKMMTLARRGGRFIKDILRGFRGDEKG